LLAELAEALGPVTARNALRTFSRRAVDKAPETLATADVPKVLDALRPMLRTLCGAEKCDDMIAHMLEASR
jgi:hypothetical protein